jgi:murein L,D-transpeptidase YcbB/YkuD
MQSDAEATSLSADSIRARFVSDSTAVVGRDTLTLHRHTAGFYAARAFEQVWENRGARDSMLAALLHVEDEGIRPTDVGADRLSTTAGSDEAARIDQDVLLTDGYFRLADALLGNRIDLQSVYRYDWYPVRRTASPAELLAAALTANDAGRAIGRALDRLRPSDPEYRALRAALAAARLDDGTPVIADGEDLAPGDTSEVTPVLRRRLARTRDWTLADPPDSLSRIYDAGLSAALRRFQARRGLEPTGILDAATRNALNTPGNRAVPLLALNLERWRWMPEALGERHVWVNIPSYELEVRHRDRAGWRHDLTMPVVVGQNGRWRTPVFSDTITQVVFNPTWTIPASIQMESYGRVDPRGIVRGPGPGNPLGRVKFVFPNPHGIYLHDTNAPARLRWNNRALSHGCIRIGDPRGLADIMLARQGWDSTRVASHFSGPWVTEPVDLEVPVPVHLVYFTAEADAAGAVRRVDDVYGWDRPLARALGYTDEELEAAREAVHPRHLAAE